MILARSAIQKGKRFETYLCEQIEEAGLGPARREIGSGSGKRKGDIYAPNIDLLIEAKNQKHIQLWQAIDQAKQQAVIGFHNPWRWMLVCRDPRSPEANPDVMAVLDFNTLLKLLVDAKEPKIKAPDRETKAAIARAKQALSQLDKLISW